jgi:putative aldouronate transport system substrate-binding protein
LLALAMLLSLAAPVVAEEPGYQRYDETVVLTTVKRTDPNAQFPEGDSLDNNVMTRYIKDKINVETKTVWEVDGTEFINKLSLDIVAGTLPDMFSLNNDDYLVYRQLLDNGLLADLTDAYEDNANWYLRDTAASFEGRHFAPYTDNGRLMGIPTGRYGYEHNQLWLRTDILDAIGMKAEEVQTIADIEAYLTKAKEAFPDTVGLALHATDPLANYSVAYSADPIAHVFGATPHYWLEQEDGSITYGSLHPGMKDTLAVLADWYAKGLIDKEFPTRVGGGLTQAVTTSGQATAWFAPWWYGWSIVDLPKNVEGADVAVVNAPVNEAGEFVAPWPSPAGEVLLVSKDCEHPEAVVRVMNLEYDMHRGFDEEAATLYDESRNQNNPTYLDISWGYLFPTSGVNMEYSNVVPTFSHGIHALVDRGSQEGLATPSEVTEAINIGRFIAGEEGYDQYRGSYYSRYVAGEITDAENVKFVYPAYSQTTESMADIVPSLLTLEQQIVLQIILGQKSVDDYDAYVEQWYAEGGQVLLDEISALLGK